MALSETLKTRMSRYRWPWTKFAVGSSLKIPTDVENSAEFLARVNKLFADPGTYVFIDTSFLMWLTKIGSQSRGEFLSWLESTCPGRVCIPIWSAHEYLRHHVSGTILEELDECLEEISGVSGKMYSYLRPFLDAPLNDGITKAETLQVHVRDSLNELGELPKNIKKWKTLYKNHASEVIEFINKFAPDRSEVFAMVDGIEALSTDRFNGRVPPGFQDRKKAMIKSVTNDGDEVTSGSNRAGDLIFWKEVLNLAAAERANNVILLSNDRKNDWQLGGREAPNDEVLQQVKRKLRPLPYTHPMLSLEAIIEARIQHVQMLDSVYLGFYLKDHGAGKTTSFVDVAIVPDPPAIPTHEALKKEKTREYKKTVAAEQASDLSAKIFADNSTLKDTVPVMTRAWINSKTSMIPSVQNFFDDIQSSFSTGQNISSWITAAHLQNFDNDMLVSFARRLHDQSIISAQGNVEAVTDLFNMLESLPPKTASCFYLGFIGSMYFDLETKAPRFPPQSPIASLIFEAETAAFSRVPIAVIRSRFERQPRPLYLLDPDTQTIEINLDHVPDADGEIILGSIRILGMELFSEAVRDPHLNFRNILGEKQEIRAEEILKIVSDRFTLPLKRMTYTGSPQTVFKIMPTSGIKQPKNINIEPSEE